MKIYLSQMLVLVFSLVSALHALEGEDIKMNADKVDYDYETGKSSFTGNVHLQYEKTEIRADRAKIISAEKQGEASGKVMILNGDQVYFCDSVTYDFEKKAGRLTQGKTTHEAWIITGREVRQVSENQFEIDQGKITLCPEENPHYFLTAKTIHLERGKELVARNVTLWVGPVPIFYWPVYKRRLDGRGNFIGFRAGHSSQLGTQLQTNINFSPTDHLDVQGRLDYYQRRGIGVGLDEKLHYDQGYGKFSQYAIHDNHFTPTRAPMDSDEEMDRYRLTAHQLHSFSNGWNSNLELNYLSDVDLLQDFFYDEFDRAIQPDNRFRIDRTTRRTSMGMIVRPRLNDFENVLERLPQFYFDVLPFELFGESSNLFFSTTSQAGYLRKTLKDTSSPVYDASRGYVRPNLSYTKRFFGWLTFNPGVSLELTQYSKSRNETSFEEEGLLRVSELFTTSFSTNLYKVYDLDSYAFLESESFFHVLTPSINFKYRPEPGIEDEEILQFDELDKRPKTSLISYELISRWHSEAQEEPLLNNHYALVYDADAESDPWRNFVADSQIRLLRDFKMNWRWDYNLQEKLSTGLRSDLSWRYENKVGASLGYWHRNKKPDLWTPEISYNLNEDIFLRGYLLYNNEDRLFERKELILVKSMHCVDLAIRYMIRENRDEEMIYFTVSSKNYLTSGLRVS